MSDPNPLRLATFASPVNAEALYSHPRQRDDGRPWIVVNMVASFDGATAVAGLSGQLGGAGDKAVFNALRSIGDVVLAGRTTAEAEGYRPRTRSDKWLAVISNRANMDWDSPLWSSPTTVLVTTTKAQVPTSIPTIRAGSEKVDVTAALLQMGERARRPDGSSPVVLCEGGPLLNGAMLAAGLVDEWCLSLASVLVGGTSGRVAHGSAELRPPHELRIVSVAAADDGLFIRALRPEHC